MIGTVQRNIFHRLGDALTAFKAAPRPSQLYAPQQYAQSNYLTFPGWDVVSADAGGQDEARVKQAMQSVSVFANMQAVANEFASAELQVKERKGDKLEDIDNHPLELLWEAPNPHMGRSYLTAYWAWSYTLVGKAFLYWLPAMGSLQEVWPIPPFMIRPVPSTKDFIGGYLFKARPDAAPITIPADLITYSHSVNLFDVRDGLSFLAAAMVDINSEIAETLWNQNFFGEQNGVPDGLITVQKDILPQDLARVRAELRDFFGGTRRGVAVAPTGEMDYKAFGRSQKDVEFKEGLALASQRIGRAMGFPDGYWSDVANRANAVQARATMIAGAVWPLCVRLHEDMNAGVVRRWYGEELRAEFKDIRLEDRELVLKEQEGRKTHWTVNELREADGKDPLDDPRGEMFVAEVAKGTPIPATPASDATEDALSAMEADVGTEEPAEGEAPAGEAPVPAEEDAPLGIEDIMPTKANLDQFLPNERQLAALAKVGIRFDPRADDLEKWEKKALKALKRFHKADTPFESNAIPLPEQVRIHEALKSAETAEAVKAAFKGEDVDTLIDEELESALAWARKAGEE